MFLFEDCPGKNKTRFAREAVGLGVNTKVLNQCKISFGNKFMGSLLQRYIWKRLHNEIASGIGGIGMPAKSSIGFQTIDLDLLKITI